MFASYAILGLAILLGVAGQIVLKTGAEVSTDVISQFLNRYTIAGLGIYFVSALIYIFAIKKIPVSLAYPSVSISYVILAILANRLWGEPLGWQQFTGFALISSGVLVLFRT